MSTPVQIKRIHAILRKQKIADDHYRAVLASFDCKGKPATSCVDLSFAQANELIACLERTTRDAASEPRLLPFEELGERPGMASPKQLRMIAGKWKDVSVVEDSKKRLEALDAFLKRFGVTDGIRGIPTHAVRKINLALDVMKIQANKPQEVVNDGQN